MTTAVMQDMKVKKLISEGGSGRHSNGAADLDKSVEQTNASVRNTNIATVSYLIDEFFL